MATRFSCLDFQQRYIQHQLHLINDGHKTRLTNAGITGSGKTFMDTYLCLLTGKKPFILCPKSVIPAWLDVCDGFGVEPLGIANYELLRGCKYYLNSSFDPIPCPYIQKIILPLPGAKTTTTIKKKRAAVEALDDEEEDEKEEKDIDVDVVDADLEDDAEEVDEAKLADEIEAEIHREDCKIAGKDIIKSSEEKNYNSKKAKDLPHKFLFNFPEDTIVIFDEAQRCRNHKTSTSRLLQACYEENMKKTLVILLSATLTDKVESFRPFGVFFGFYQTLQDYGGWLRRELMKNKAEFDRKGLEKKQRQLEVIHRALFPRCGFRVSFKDIQHALPKNKVIARCYILEKSFEIDNLYEELRIAYLELKDAAERSQALGKIVKLRQQIEILKVPIAIQLAIDLLEHNNQSVIFFVNFTDTMWEFATELEYLTGIECKSFIYGGQTLEERQMAIRAFQTGESRVIVANLKAGGMKDFKFSITR
jgi:hypothetical protein